MCREQVDTRPAIKFPKKLNVIGFNLNPDSRAMVYFCKLSWLEHEYHEVNMLKGEHLTEEFKTAHPSGVLPIL